MIKIVKAELEGISPYSQSRFHDTPRKEQESHEGYRDRIGVSIFTMMRRSWRFSSHP